MDVWDLGLANRLSFCSDNAARVGRRKDFVYIYILLCILLDLYLLYFVWGYLLFWDVRSRRVGIKCSVRYHLLSRV